MLFVWIARVNASSNSAYSCKKKSHGVYQQIGDSTDPFIPGMSQRLLLQFRLVPFSISPHTAKGRLKHLCAFLVPSLWLINYVLPQRRHREAQRFLELGLRPRRPRLTAEGRPKHLCALLVPSLWLINYVLPQRGHREAQRFLELGLRPKPQTPNAIHSPTRAYLWYQIGRAHV